ncbi:MAG: hypothetical protein K9G42_04510 [Pedobacter sp.]|nr:hypothetical protein [Pedobacter sp.]
MKKLMLYIILCLAFSLTGCPWDDEPEIEEEIVCGPGYGSISISQRSDLVAPERLLEGTLQFPNSGTSSGVSPYIAAATSNNSTAIMILGGSDSCIREGGFCVITSSSPRVQITDIRIVNGTPKISQYIAVSGTVHVLQMNPFTVRLENVAMRVAPVPDNQATGSFTVNGTMCRKI